MAAPALAENILQASVATTFDVLAWEMELAGARCILLDTVIGAMMRRIPEGEQGEFHEGMQTVDLLCQQLTSLSAFTRRISDSVSSEISVPVAPALGDITLGALADRMCTALGGQEKGVNDGDGAGEIDLF